MPRERTAAKKAGHASIHRLRLTTVEKDGCQGSLVGVRPGGKDAAGESTGGRGTGLGVVRQDTDKHAGGWHGGQGGNGPAVEHKRRAADPEREL